MSKSLSIAVVGSGISGLSAAWLLSQKHDVTLFEREPLAGGHANTVDVHDGRDAVAVDAGFIVYNTASYPNLIALFDYLRVPTTPTDMGFAVSLDEGALEYSGDGLAGLFGQWSNLLRPRHWRMIADTLRFFRESRSLLDGDAADGPTLGAYLATGGYSQTFINCHILPMAAAIWSTPTAKVLNFPAAAFVRFFDNHGLLQVSNRPEWRTVVGGSRQYVTRMLEAMRGRVALGVPVRSISRRADGVAVTHGGGVSSFDACVIATHADEALQLLADPDQRERDLLGAFGYSSNRAVLHGDASLMPRRRRLWSSWNYLGSRAGGEDALSVTYWMNKLQPLGDVRDLFVTLNPARDVAAGTEFASFNYSHPIFDRQAMAAQEHLWGLQGHRQTWFCGSYFGSGFHEDGLQAGLAVAEDIGGVRRPWTVRNESGRIHLGAGLPPAVATIREAAE